MKSGTRSSGEMNSGIGKTGSAFRRGQFGISGSSSILIGAVGAPIGI